MSMPELLSLVIHLVAAVSGWSLLFARRELLERTQAKFASFSVDYLRYATVASTTGCSIFFLLFKLFEHFFSSLPNWVWLVQSISTALSFCLVHFYLLRVLGQPDDAGKV